MERVWCTWSMADLTVLAKTLLGTVRNSVCKEGDGVERDGGGTESKRRTKITEGYDGVKERAMEMLRERPGT